MQAQSITTTSPVSEPARSAASPYFDTAHAAMFLGMGKRNLERLRATGEGPKFVKIGRRCAYRRETLEAWVAGREFASTCEAKKAGIR